MQGEMSNWGLHKFYKWVWPWPWIFNDHKRINWYISDLCLLRVLSAGCAAPQMVVRHFGWFLFILGDGHLGW